MVWSMASSLQFMPNDATLDLTLPPRPPTAGPPEPVGFRRPPPPPDAATQRRLLDDGVERLKQQLRDALFARTTSQISEIRVLKKSFVAFDTDASGSVDITEFCKALEVPTVPAFPCATGPLHVCSEPLSRRRCRVFPWQHLGLHIDGVGMPGRGGVPMQVVQGLFDAFDGDGSGQIDYTEFIGSLDMDVTYRHF